VHPDPTCSRHQLRPFHKLPSSDCLNILSAATMLSIRKRKQPAVDSTETTPLQLKKKRWTGRILNTGKKGNTM